ncbi:MAG: heme-binding protein [Gammaproteobacteria bacterium]|nr:MAG: heme-binding protein [Gammaproteobacteria bacterium]
MAILNSQRLLASDASQALASAAIALARQQGVAVAVAVVDAAGQLKAFLADDQAPWVASELCQRKARTALLGLASGDLGQALADQPALMHSFAAVPGVTLLAGGIPVRVEGQVVGAIGVGGGTPAQDADIALQALAHAGLA